ncbi:hypothetical protein BaRGS_00024210 [Batillaria attramentaria]|uniref:Uncharacterized protein n=1 Tax=Batillaria attramentaria TaxID=370345 RepID=A0ABD0KBU5_9CAEN
MTSVFLAGHSDRVLSSAVGLGVVFSAKPREMSRKAVFAMSDCIDEELEYCRGGNLTKGMTSALIVVGRTSVLAQSVVVLVYPNIRTPRTESEQQRQLSTEMMMDDVSQRLLAQ